MNRPQNRRAKSEPIRRFLKSVPEGIRHASAPARLASERIYAKLVQLKRDYNESITVISSIWTNGCGIGIVTVPWALEKAGLIPAIIILVIFAVIMSYSAILINRNSRRLMGKCDRVEDPLEMPEFTIVAHHYLGQVGEYITLLAVCLIILCFNIVAYILLGQYIFAAGISIYILLQSNETDTSTKVSYLDDAACVLNQMKKTIPPPLLEPGNVSARFLHDFLDDVSPNGSGSDSKWTFSPAWDVNFTIPLYCLLLFGLLNFKRETIFNRLNAFGSITTIFLFTVVIYKACTWRSYDILTFSDELSEHFVPLFSSLGGTVVLAGYMQGAYIVHTSLVSIVKDNKDQNNNDRDIIIGMILLLLTYMFVGFVFYLCYPGWKACISDVFINNLSRDDILMPILCLIMTLRILFCYPMHAVSLRAILFQTILNKRFPGYGLTILFNVILLAIGCIFAIFYDKVGDIFRYGCSFCAMIYIYIIPCVVEMLSQKQQMGFVPIWSYILHICMCLLGTGVFIAQFFVQAYE